MDIDLDKVLGKVNARIEIEAWQIPAGIIVIAIVTRIVWGC